MSECRRVTRCVTGTNQNIDQILQVVRRMNKYMEQQAPWKVAKTDLKRAGTILYTATEGLRICACHLAPVMPARTATVLDILDDQERSTEWGGLKSGVTLSAHEALFPRLELPEN